MDDDDGDARDMIWSRLRQQAIRLLERDDTASVFRKKNVLETLRRKVYSISEENAELMVRHRAAGNVDRRQFLKLLGFGTAGAVVSASGAGYVFGERIFGETPTGHATVGDVSFDNVVNAGNQGVDDSGETPIDDFLSTHLGGSTLVEFPPGEYLITEYQSVSSGNIGIVGTGEDHTDVQFICQEGSPDGNEGRWIKFSGNEVALHNFSINIRDDNQTATDMWLNGVTGSVKNLEYVGRIPPEWNFGKKGLLAVDTPQPGVLEVNGVYIRGGAERVDYPNGLAGLRIGAGNQGEIIVRNSHFEGCNSSALRLTNGDGVVTLRDSFFANNANTNIRIHNGRHPSKNTTIENCKVLVDGDLSRLPYSRDGDEFGGSGQSSACIQLGSDYNAGGAVYREVDVCVTYDSPSGVSVFGTGGGFGEAQGRTEFYNCRFRNTAGETWTEVMGSGGPYVFENCHFTGDGGTISGNIQMNGCCVDSSISVNADTSDLSQSGCDQPDCEPGPVSEPAGAGPGSANGGNPC